MPRDIAGADTAVRSPSIDRLLADMVDLLSGSEDDDPDAALAAALAAEGDREAAAAAGSPAGSPPRRKSSSRRVRKPARFKDAEAGLGSPPAAQSAQRSDGGADRGPTVWPSPPEDSFINDDEPAISAPPDVDHAPDPSPQPKRCGSWASHRSFFITGHSCPCLGCEEHHRRENAPEKPCCAMHDTKILCSPNVVPVSAGGRRTHSRSRLTRGRKSYSAR